MRPLWYLNSSLASKGCDLRDLRFTFLSGLFLYSSIVILVPELVFNLEFQALQREKQRELEKQKLWQIVFSFGAISILLEKDQMGVNPQDAIKKLKVLMDQGQMINSVFFNSSSENFIP